MPRARILYGIPCRTYSYRQRFEYGTMDVGVASVAAADAPVVARARWIDEHKTLQAADYRWHAGHLWEETRFYSTDPRVAPELHVPDSYGFVRALTDAFRRRVPLTQAERDVAADLNPIRPSQRALKKGPDLSDVPEAVAFRAVAREYLFVDGMLHERSLGPTISMGKTWDSKPDSPTAPIRNVSMYRSARTYRCTSTTFPAEGHEALDEIVSGLNLTVAGQNTAAGLAAGFEFLRPDLLDPRRLEAGALQETAIAAMGGLGGVRLNDAGDRVIRHLLDIRRAFSEFERAEEATGVRKGTYSSGDSWLSERDLSGLVPLVTDLVDPALMGRLKPETVLDVSVGLSRMGVVSPLEMDDVALGGLGL